jgi:hypothetical protein
LQGTPRMFVCLFAENELQLEHARHSNFLQNRYFHQTKQQRFCPFLSGEDPTRETGSSVVTRVVRSSRRCGEKIDLSVKSLFCGIDVLFL